MLLVGATEVAIALNAFCGSDASRDCFERFCRSDASRDCFWLVSLLKHCSSAARPVHFFCGPTRCAKRARTAKPAPKGRAHGASQRNEPKKRAFPDGANPSSDRLQEFSDSSSMTRSENDAHRVHRPLGLDGQHAFHSYARFHLTPCGVSSRRMPSSASCFRIASARAKSRAFFASSRSTIKASIC